MQQDKVRGTERKMKKKLERKANRAVGCAEPAPAAHCLVKQGRGPLWWRSEHLAGEGCHIFEVTEEKYVNS
jgi:hypothetical protein